MSKREFNNIIRGLTAPSVMEESSGVKRGAWTHEEDELLRNCIEKYGEGRWHLIPQRAGLKRCRKSCRLRWLNYLKPNIKRGPFEADEVDLIIRMHKLLGNRWALISGRIPGRTANDVKNYWNTNLRKKQAQVARLGRVPQSSEQIIITRSNIIKPRSRSFSKATSNPLDGKAPVSNLEDHNVGKIHAAEEAAEAEAAGDENMWWESLLSIDVDVDVADVQNSIIGWESGSDIEPISSYVFSEQNAVGDNIPLHISHGWNT